MKTILLKTYIINFGTIFYYLIPFIIILLITCNIFYYLNKKDYDKKITIFNFWNPYKNLGYDNGLYGIVTIVTLLISLLYFLILDILSKHEFILTF
jgi:hypothetical protein